MAPATAPVAAAVTEARGPAHSRRQRQRDTVPTKLRSISEAVAPAARAAERSLSMSRQSSPSRPEGFTRTAFQDFLAARDPAEVFIFKPLCSREAEHFRPKVPTRPGMGTPYQAEAAVFQSSLARLHSRGLI